MKLTLADIALLSGGILSKGSDPQLVINDITIDSRTVDSNKLFVALMGEKCDGHNFVEPTLTKFKLAAAIVSNTFTVSLPNMIYVDDTVKALGIFAANYRKRFNAKIVAITGSNGKTTLKEMLNSILVTKFGENHVLATHGNLNNHLGVPLTLLRLEQSHQVAIIEMGMNHPKELDYLTKLAKPDLALVNNVMFAHAGFFSGLEDIANAKAEIFHGLGDSGIACINTSNQFDELFVSQVPANAGIYKFGSKDSGLYLESADNLGNIVIVTPIGKMRTKLQILGVHNAQNALMVTALAFKLGCSLADISLGLSSYGGYKHRLEQKNAFNGALIIDDSYNANLDSVKAAILAIKNLPKPHWFIFADLGELGKFSSKVHEEVAVFAMNEGVDCLISIGELSRITHDKFNGTKSHAMTKSAIVEYCHNNLPKTATVLIKGSNSAELWTIADDLQFI